MNSFLILAALVSMAGGIAAPFGAILIKSYKEERGRLEAGLPPTYLPPIEEIYEQPSYQPPNYQYPVEIESQKKAIALLPQTTQTVERAVQTPTTISTNWINNFISQTALLWGNQGSGKSWMARYLAKLKKDKGYRVIVLDPDSNPSEWQGLESYHDFEDIEDFLKWYVDELKARYSAFNSSTMKEDEWRDKLWTDGKAIAVICEEVTTYIDLISDKELLNQFFRLGLTKSRKQEMPLTFVSHNNTQSALGGIKGLGNLIERMLQLNLETTINPSNLQPTSSGKGRVKLDGSLAWIPVALPTLSEKITDFGEPSTKLIDCLPKNENKITDQQKWDRLILESTNDEVNELIERFRSQRTGETTEIPSEPLKQAQGEEFNQSLKRFTKLKLPLKQAQELVQQLRNEMNQTQVISLLWEAKPGSNKAYQEALKEYKELVQED